MSSTPTLLVIGDSHAVIWEGNNVLKRAPVPRFSGVRSVHLGAALAFNLLDRDRSTLGKWGIQVFETIKTYQETHLITAVMLCFGEIDIRTQLIRRAIEMHSSIEHQVEEIAERLSDFADRCFQQFQLPVLIWEPIPTASTSYSNFDPRFPIVGSEIERNYATHLMSASLRKRCDSLQAHRRKVYSFGVSEQLSSLYSTHTEFYEDGCHLNLRGLQVAILALHDLANRHGLHGIKAAHSVHNQISQEACLREISHQARVIMSSELFGPPSLTRRACGFCFHTGKDPSPQVIIDLPYASMVEQLVIFNRFDDCFERSKSLTISVSRSDGIISTVFESNDLWVNDQRPITISIPNDAKPVKAITLSLREQEFFHLGEVQIWERSFLSYFPPEKMPNPTSDD